ncbi:MAG: transposase [Rhodoferax sp.]
MHRHGARAGRRSNDFAGFANHLRPGHVHMPAQIPPKYAVSQVVAYIKGLCGPARRLKSQYGATAHCQHLGLRAWQT